MTTDSKAKQGEAKRSPEHRHRRSKSNRVYYILPLLMVACTLFYYFGELVDFYGWKSLHWQIFYTVHDVHRLFFLAPILYAGYVARIKGAVIITLVSVMIFMPRAIFISPYPDPTLRAVVFIIAAGIMGTLTGIVRNETEKRLKIENILVSERDRLLEVMGKMDEGVLIIGPDCRIRFTNPSMEKNFGTGIGSYCYKYLRNLDSPCGEICKLPEIIKGKVEKWEYHLPDGRTYEIIGSPYTDSDGVVCQLAIYRDITKQKANP
jgi:PAS domain-containing protein